MMWTESPPKADNATKTGMTQLQDPSILSPTDFIVEKNKRIWKEFIWN